MKNFLLVIAFFAFTYLQSQRSISGTFSPAEDYTWLIAYRLEPGTQVYVADTAIENGQFEMEIPENTPSGMYRLVYAVPQDEFYFDLLYTGKEDITLNFETGKGVVFDTSEENRLFYTYFDEIKNSEQHLISYYTAESNDKEKFGQIIQNLRAVQDSFVKKSEGMLARQFIQANRPYIPSKHKSLRDYVENRKNTYFDFLDVTNPILQASGFLIDKLGNYVFTALPVKITPS